MGNFVKEQFCMNIINNKGDEIGDRLQRRVEGFEISHARTKIVTCIHKRRVWKASQPSRTTEEVWDYSHRGRKCLR